MATNRIIKATTSLTPPDDPTIPYVELKDKPMHIETCDWHNLLFPAKSAKALYAWIEDAPLWWNLAIEKAFGVLLAPDEYLIVLNSGRWAVDVINDPLLQSHTSVVCKSNVPGMPEGFVWTLDWFPTKYLTMGSQCYLDPHWYIVMPNHEWCAIG